MRTDWIMVPTDAVLDLPNDGKLLKALARSKHERILEIEKGLAFAEERLSLIVKVRAEY
jgi:hypothetical protein